MKKTLEISSFYISVPRIMIICYTYFEIMTCDRCNCFSFWTMFCPFTPVTASKNKNFKKMKKIPGDIIIYISAPKIMILCYTVPEIWCVTDELLFFILSYFLPFYPPNSLKNENFKKLKKKHLGISSFYTSVLKLIIICYTISAICMADVIFIFHFWLLFAPLSP